MKRSRVPLASFVRSPYEGVWAHPQNDPFAYSDGREVEDRILQILKDTRDLSVGSEELAARIQDWPTEYHFVDTRANLLRHVPFGPGTRVLELGAGCGAITRFLGEGGCDVVAVEGSLLRARCARERTRDLDNVSVYCANFQDVAFTGTFDVVTLIGVLEYAPMFFAGENPIDSCLQVARSALAPGGMLVVAIENQLGLKYFAGATEDHLGTHFSGIENRYLPDGVQTMGRRQIERALRASGFIDVSFQYPFPDYKLPRAIVFEAGLERQDFLASEIVRHLYARDYSGQDRRSIDTSQVWPLLEDNGLLGELANSFLILAREQPTGAADDVLAFSYSLGRARPFQTQTCFRTATDGSIVVEKALMYPAQPASAPRSPGISHRLVKDRYVSGLTLHSAITAALRAGDSQRMIALVRKWLDFLAERAGGAASTVWDCRLPGEFWDCTPGNLLEVGGGLRYFDAEWVSDPGPKVLHLLLRYLLNVGFGEATAPHFQECFKTRPARAIGLVLEALGVGLTEEMLEDFLKDFNETNATIFPLYPSAIMHHRDFRASKRRSAQDMVLKAVRHIARALPT